MTASFKRLPTRWPAFTTSTAAAIVRNGALRRVAVALLACAAQTASAGSTTPDAAMTRLWNALSHEVGAAPDTAALETIFADRAVIFGVRQGVRGPELNRQEARDFIERLRAPRAYRFVERELDRRTSVEGRYAAVESRVESTRVHGRTTTTFVGINSAQLYRSDDGWVILSLYYYVVPTDSTD